MSSVANWISIYCLYKQAEPLHGNVISKGVFINKTVTFLQYFTHCCCWI